MSRKKKAAVIILALALCAALTAGGITLHSKRQMSKIPGLTFVEALAETTKGDPDAVITVGIIQNGQASYKVYGEDSRELPAELHTYEIGSLTKTLTAALVQKAVSEGKLNLAATVDRYLPLPEGNAYPTIAELLTHTSGYKGYYFERPMISNYLQGKNAFYRVTRDMVIEKAKTLSMDGENYGFTYSNFGFAMLGLVLEAVYDTDYTTLANDFIEHELGLADTRISDQTGDLGNYWDWAENDAYLPAGAIMSNISDMLSYAQMQLDGDPRFAACHQGLKTIDASPTAYQAMGIRLDEIGMAWIIDCENGVIWHNGGTGDYNSYLGFDPQTGTAVVVLTNRAPGYRISATVLGVKLLSELNRDGA